MELKESLIIKKVDLINLLNKISVMSLFISYYSYLFAEVFLGNKNIRILFLIVCYVTFSVSVLLEEKIRIKKVIFIYLSFSLLLYIISIFFWQKKFDINLYLSPITTIIIIHNYKYFLLFLEYFIYFTFILAFYEYIFKEYIFIVYRNTPYGFRALDEYFFAGSANIFRSKVFFEGPLALSQLTMGLSFIFRNKIKLLLILFIIAIFANGRLGMLISVFIIILYYTQKYDIKWFLKKPIIIFSLIISLTSLFFIGLSLLDEYSLNRLVEAFNVRNEGNVERIRFWLQGIDTWWNYNLLHKIFGNNGYYESLYHNNAENGWFTLLVNNGIIGFLYYLIPLALLLIIEFTKKTINIYYLLLLFFVMFIQTFHLGASANLMYWLIIFSFIYNQYEVKI